MGRGGAYSLGLYPVGWRFHQECVRQDGYSEADSQKPNPQKPEGVQWGTVKRSPYRERYLPAECRDGGRSASPRASYPGQSIDSACLLPSPNPFTRKGRCSGFYAAGKCPRAQLGEGPWARQGEPAPQGQSQDWSAPSPSPQRNMLSRDCPFLSSRPVHAWEGSPVAGSLAGLNINRPSMGGSIFKLNYKGKELSGESLSGRSGYWNI